MFVLIFKVYMVAGDKSTLLTILLFLNCPSVSFAQLLIGDFVKEI
jgi:hypothetical protein